MTLPTIKSDLVLMHAPAYFDFRNRGDIYFPFLGTSGDVPITPLYEYFPIGFKSLQRWLSARGYKVDIINLSSIFLQFPHLDLKTIIESFDTNIIGIDLHWLIHVQGSLEVAKQIKKFRSDVYIIFGGISSTYFAKQLIAYPFVDMVMRGYDTHIPMGMLLDEVNSGGRFEMVPNLLWRDHKRTIHQNEFSHKPKVFGCGIDWSDIKIDESEELFPIKEILSTYSSGCVHHCTWCGGSNKAFKRINESEHAVCSRDSSEVAYEFNSIQKISNESHNTFYLYTVGTYNQSETALKSFIEHVAAANLKSVSYEVFSLLRIETLKLMVKANKYTILTLSPESHDLKVSKLCGRGNYTNEEMENWIERAMDLGIYQIDIWYFIGMPGQDFKSIQGTVDYCRYLLKKFNGLNIQPFICPMLPFVDPASTIYENPKKYGYHLFFKTLEEHRRGMENASLINRINYETKWLSRQQIFEFGYKAVQDLMTAKAENGYFPESFVNKYNAKIEDAIHFNRAVYEVDIIKNKNNRKFELEKLKNDIIKRNNQVLYSGVSNQAFPENRKIGNRWIDEFCWNYKDLERLPN